MPAFTLKNMPEELLDRLRERAERQRRSLTQEIYHLLELALESSAIDPRAEAQRQAEEWSRLGGGWQSDESRQDEIAGIYGARTEGRRFEL